MHIKSERLNIRTPQVGDETIFYNAIVESQPELQEYMAWAQSPPNFERTKQNLDRAMKAAEKKEDYRLLIFRHDGTFVGCSGLHDIDWSIPKAEIGYWVRTSMSGRGYITEAVQAITKYAQNQLGMKRLELQISSTNLRSQAVANRAGYTQEAILKKHRTDPNGRIVDTYIYATFANENR